MLGFVEFAIPACSSRRNQGTTPGNKMGGVDGVALVRAKHLLRCGRAFIFAVPEDNTIQTLVKGTDGHFPL